MRIANRMPKVGFNLHVHVDLWEDSVNTWEPMLGTPPSNHGRFFLVPVPSQYRHCKPFCRPQIPNRFFALQTIRLRVVAATYCGGHWGCRQCSRESSGLARNFWGPCRCSGTGEFARALNGWSRVCQGEPLRYSLGHTQLREGFAA